MSFTALCTEKAFQVDFYRYLCNIEAKVFTISHKNLKAADEKSAYKKSGIPT
ncbi:hypothetical protein Cst_c03510 [Thermoclostridium stercorarium subsp. stercorarium DSM 8532]|uniref:Uncharacterized protein n=1 Tax=Thermoclostridium stercorarium (strain ATCC 35414 / DSM 8532 / NCIMB 11754) TaxID=1121335 RepID=L7VH86_THES1|nr:hypothetical protein Cst_c03510 [Thermoclostridium stercorarium subsp. stercorarium DSM 8532]